MFVVVLVVVLVDCAVFTCGGQEADRGPFLPPLSSNDHVMFDNFWVLASNNVEFDRGGQLRSASERHARNWCSCPEGLFNVEEDHDVFARSCAGVTLQCDQAHDVFARSCAGVTLQCDQAHAVLISSCVH